MNLCRSAVPVLALIFAGACVPSGRDPGALRDAGGGDAANADAANADAQTLDAAPVDAAPFPDATVMDALPSPDADPAPDAVPRDADEPDAVPADADPAPDAVAADALAPDAIADAGFMDAAPPTDTGPRDAGGPWIEVGTGSGSFMPLATSVMEINRGIQGGGRYGGYNLWIAVRALGFDPNQVDLQITALDSGSGAEIARVNWSTGLNSVGGGVYEMFGIPLVLNDCCMAESANVTIRITANDNMSHTAMDQRMGTVAAECVPPPGGGDVCP